MVRVSYAKLSTCKINPQTPAESGGSVCDSAKFGGKQSNGSKNVAVKTAKTC